MKFRSYAKWPTGVVSTPRGDDITYEDHHNQKAAEAVCRMLQQNCFGSQGEHHPVETWWELVEDDA